MKKLLLEENDILQVEEPEINDLQLSNIVSQLIQTEWNSIDVYNSMLITLQDESLPAEKEHLKEVINYIITEHYTNIGQLEGVLQNVNPIADFSVDELES